MAEVIFGCWVRLAPVTQPTAPSSTFLAIMTTSGVTIGRLQIQEISSTFTGSNLTASSWRARAGARNGAGTIVNYDATDPYADPTIGQNPNTWPRSNWGLHLWALHLKTSTDAATANGAIQIYLDGSSILNQTGIILPDPGGDWVYGIGANGDLDNVWAVTGSSLPAMDGNGVLSSPGSALFYSDFAAGDRSAWADWEILNPFTATPHIVSDVGSSGGYGMSRWTSSPGSAVAGNVPYAGLKRTVAADVTILGTWVLGAYGTSNAERTILLNVDGTPRTVSTPGVVTVGGNLLVTGNATISGSTSVDINASLDALGT